MEETYGTRTDYNRRFGVFVGVDDYGEKSKGFRPLRCAVNDARAVCDLLRDEFGYKHAHTKVLTNENATKVNVERVLLDWISQQKLTEWDSLLVFFACHGFMEGGEGFLAVNGSDRNSPVTCISMTWLLAELDELPNCHRAVILDTCFAGSLFDAAKNVGFKPSNSVSNTRGAKVVTDDIVTSYVNEPAFVGLASTGYSTATDGLPGTIHSAFTIALIDVLIDRANSERDDHVFWLERVRIEVERRMEGVRGQKPEWGRLGHGSGDFVFRPTVERSTSGERARQIERLLEKWRGQDRLRQRQLEEIVRLTKRIQTNIEAHQRSTMGGLGALAFGTAGMPRIKDNRETAKLGEDLVQLVESFQESFEAEQQDEVDRLHIRLAKATAMLCEGRLQDALKMTHQDALREFTKTEGQIDREVSVLTVRFQAFMELGQLQEALKCAKRVVKLRPDGVPFRFTTGLIHGLLGNSEDFQSIYTRLAREAVHGSTAERRLELASRAIFLVLFAGDQAGVNEEDWMPFYDRCLKVCESIASDESLPVGLRRTAAMETADALVLRWIVSEGDAEEDIDACVSDVLKAALSVARFTYEDESQRDRAAFLKKLSLWMSALSLWDKESLANLLQVMREFISDLREGLMMDIQGEDERGKTLIDGAEDRATSEGNAILGRMFGRAKNADEQVTRERPLDQGDTTQRP